MLMFCFIFLLEFTLENKVITEKRGIDHYALFCLVNICYRKVRDKGDVRDVYCYSLIRWPINISVEQIESMSFTFLVYREEKHINEQRLAAMLQDFKFIV